MTLFWGRGGLPIPLPVSVTLAIGTPIRVKQNPNPTAAEVDAVQATVGSLFIGAPPTQFISHKRSWK